MRRDRYYIAVIKNEVNAKFMTLFVYYINVNFEGLISNKNFFDEKLFWFGIRYAFITIYLLRYTY